MADPRDEELAQLRERPDNVHLLGGFGPLLVGVVLFVMMVLLAPTVAPEQVVELPVGGEPTTTLEVATTTTTAAGGVVPDITTTSSTATTVVTVP